MTGTIKPFEPSVESLAILIGVEIVALSFYMIVMAVGRIRELRKRGKTKEMRLMIVGWTCPLVVLHAIGMMIFKGIDILAACMAEEVGLACFWTLLGWLFLFYIAFFSDDVVMKLHLCRLACRIANVSYDEYIRWEKDEE